MSEYANKGATSQTDPILVLFSTSAELNLHRTFSKFAEFY